MSENNEGRKRKLVRGESSKTQKTPPLYIQDDIKEESLLPFTTNTYSDVVDFIFVPFTLERMIIYGGVVCLESFLFTFTILPFRVLFALWSWVKNGFHDIYFVQKIDLLKFFLIVFGFLSLRNLNAMTMATYVEESTLKLKMLWACLEFFNKVFTAYGHNILGGLYYALSSNSSSGGRPQLKRSLPFYFVLAIVYIIIHSSILIVHLSVMDLAISSGNTSLLALLILVQFAEMKSSALKFTTPEKLKEICYEDIVERFQLIVFMCMLAFHRIGTWIEAISIETKKELPWRRDLSFDDVLPLLIIYFSEVFVDWLKHSSICNISSISPWFYSQRSKEISTKILAANYSSFLTDRTHSVSTDFGLWTIPLSVVVLKFSLGCISELTIFERYSNLSSILLLVFAFFLVCVVLRELSYLFLKWNSRLGILFTIDKWLLLDQTITIPKEQEKKES